MTEERPLTPEDRRVLAGELALGLVEGEERAQALALAKTDPAFVGELSYWTGRFSPLFEQIEPASPPRSVWMGIEDALGRPDPRAQSNVVRLRRRVGFWQACAGAAGALAASLALILLVQPVAREAPPVEQQQQRPSPAKPMVAVLSDDEERLSMVAVWDSRTQALTVINASSTQAGSGHSHELWLIPADGTPRSLGLLSKSPKTPIQMRDGMPARMTEGITLAVSLEPTGGSPTGAPTGPVIATGSLEGV